MPFYHRWRTMDIILFASHATSLQSFDFWKQPRNSRFTLLLYIYNYSAALNLTIIILFFFFFLTLSLLSWHDYGVDWMWNDLIVYFYLFFLQGNIINLSRDEICKYLVYFIVENIFKNLYIQFEFQLNLNNFRSIRVDECKYFPFNSSNVHINNNQMK